MPGEDPYLTGEYGSYIVRGTQDGGPDPRYLQAAGTMKHFQVLSPPLTVYCQLDSESSAGS